MIKLQSFNYNQIIKSNSTKEEKLRYQLMVTKYKKLWNIDPNMYILEDIFEYLFLSP